MEATRLFYCYSHEDKSLQDQLVKQLASLERLGLIAGWSDRDISAGLQWKKEIDKHLNEADIILLLISPDFIASNYCYSVEVKRAMKRHEAGEARVIPIILRPANWQEMPFGQLQALPAEGKPITKWGNRDEAFLDVTQGVRKVIEGFLPIPDASQRQDKLNIGTPTANRIRAFGERLDWKPYLNMLAMGDTNDDSFKNFIALRKLDRVEEQVNGTKRKIGLLELDTFIDSWLKDNKTPHLAILGGYGAGKTWYCHWLARKLATSYLNGDPQGKVPVLISLRLFTEVTDLPSVLELFWDHMGNGDFTLFKQAVFQGNVLVILDGFDEMSLNFRKQVRSDNFLKLRRLFTERSKIIITSRDTYFTSEEEQQHSLTPPPFPSLIPSLDTSLFSKSQIAPIRTIHLDVFNRNDIHRYFTLLLGEKPGKNAYQRVAATYDLLDLASRPILANIIAKTIEDIGEDVAVNAAVLYDRYTTDWMKRESWRFPGFHIVRTFMQHLAMSMQMNESEIVSDVLFDSMINDHFRAYTAIATNDDLQDVKRKIQNCTFLTRDSSGR